MANPIYSDISSFRYTCPCCGYKMFKEPPGSYDICEICYWEDDQVQFDDPGYAGGANAVSLKEGQQNYARFGACTEDMMRYVRKPNSFDVKDPDWAPY
ncbi:hypothetical protein EGT74_13680 [Chitinophaga lutea]|uniref:Cysteine-rich CPCC domain-containing protein n=2 Tax=Chitinophaga lutea TaxID=2488634 RepID=A0A3N4Q8R9_9BACT|nr:hypothetical protein EGT74_13680 [Chitinophaga lutea]